MQNQIASLLPELLCKADFQPGLKLQIGDLFSLSRGFKRKMPGTFRPGHFKSAFQLTLIFY